MFINGLLFLRFGKCPKETWMSPFLGPDVRCMMINLDPDTAAKDARVMKTVVGLNQNNAGVYGTRPRLFAARAICARSI